MPRVKCASCDCTWNNDKGYCSYVGEIKLNDCFYHTVNEGFQHFHKCKMYEQDESIEEMQKDIIKFFKEKGE